MNGTASYAVQQTPLPTTSGSLRYSARKQQSKGITYGMPFERDVTSHGAVRSQPGTVSGASSIYSMYRNRSETSFRSQSQVPSRVPSRGPSRGLVPTDEPSYFTMQHSSNGRRNLADHPAHAFYQPRSPVAMHQMRPRSPYAYPSRLKRPGYRPSSPALSEVYRPAPRPPFGYQSATAHQGTSLRTVSPLSMYSMKVSPTVWQQGPNRSDPILGCQQLSPKERYLRGQEYQDISHGRLIEGIQTRTANMIPSEMYRSIDSVSTAEAPSPPLFYDYSEDFQQQSTYHAPALGPIFNETPEISENNNRRIYYELDNRNEGQSEPHITELPAEVPPSRRNFAMVTQPKERGASASALVEFVHKRLSHTYSVREAATRSDDPSFEQANRTSTRSSRFSAIDVGALRSLAVIEDATTDIKAAAVNMKTHPSASGLDGETRKQSHPSPEAHGEPLSVRHTVGHRILSSYKRSQEFLAGNPNRSTANTNISLYSRRSRSSSPSTGSIYSTGSPSIRGRNREPKADPGSVEASLQMQLGNAASALDAQKPLPEANWAIRPETAQTEIHCPVPKRSISSPSHRERFSSILSIDEGLLELDELAVKPEQQSVITTFSKAKTLGNRSDPSYPITSIQKSYPTLHDISEVQAPMPTHDGQDSHVGWVSSGSFVETGSGKQWAPPDDRASTHISNVAHPLTTTLPSKVMDTGESAKSSHNSLHRASGDPVMGTQPTLHSAISVTGGEYKNLDTTKELPLRPRSSIVSFAPLRQHDSVCLPFAFTPLRPEERDHDTDSVAELGRLAASYLNRSERFDSEPSATSPKMKLKVWSDQASLVSSLRSNLDQMDGEHSKAEGPLKLELPMTMTAEPLIEKSHSTMPRFTLKVHRASSSPACAVKITKPRPSTEAVIRASRESSSVRRSMIARVFFSLTHSVSSGKEVLLPFQDHSPGSPNPNYRMSLLRTTVADRAQYKLGL